METAYHYEVKVNWEADRKGSMSSPVLNTNRSGNATRIPKRHAGHLVSRAFASSCS
jgi:hypothetical protein